MKKQSKKRGECDYCLRNKKGFRYRLNSGTYCEICYPIMKVKQDMELLLKDLKSKVNSLNWFYDPKAK